MVGTQDLPLFLLSAVLLNITPGQDTLYILGRSISQGRRAGVLSVLGVITGCFVHTVAAALGLSAILATSASVFMAVKLVGAAYLVYLGIRMLLDRAAGAGQPTEYTHESAWAIYRAGLLTNILNPKVALFFLAFLPQFVDPSAGSKIVPFLFLGALFICTGTMWCLVLAWSASAVGRHLSEAGWGASVLRRATGVLFVGLGVKLAAGK